MVHTRDDYNRIQDPEGKIGADEPVILFRAQDKHFLAVLEAYRTLLREDEEMDEAQRRKMIDALNEQSTRGSAWQWKHGRKTPDM